MPGASRQIQHQRNLLVVHVGPESPDEFVELARDLATPAHSRIVLLYVREVPETLPIDALELADADVRFLDRFRALLASRGIEVRVEVTDARHAGRAVVDCARAHRARALLLEEPGARHGRLGPVAAYALRHLDGPRLILVSG